MDGELVFDVVEAMVVSKALFVEPLKVGLWGISWVAQLAFSVAKLLVDLLAVDWENARGRQTVAW